MSGFVCLRVSGRCVRVILLAVRVGRTSMLPALAGLPSYGGLSVTSSFDRASEDRDPADAVDHQRWVHRPDHPAGLAGQDALGPEHLGRPAGREVPWLHMA